MGEPLECGQIRARIPYPAHRNCHKDDNSHGPPAESSRQGLGAGAFGLMILALSLNQLCDLGQVTSLL